MPVAINVTTYVTDCGCFWKLIAFSTENGTGPVIVIARKVQVNTRRNVCMTRTAAGIT
jgi:hypothetical protein